LRLSFSKRFLLRYIPDPLGKFTHAKQSLHFLDTLPAGPFSCLKLPGGISFEESISPDRRLGKKEETSFVGSPLPYRFSFWPRKKKRHDFPMAFI